jgi:hypothetical protein
MNFKQPAQQISKNHRGVAHFQTGEAKTIGVLLFVNEQ